MNLLLEAVPPWTFSALYFSPSVSALLSPVCHSLHCQKARIYVASQWTESNNGLFSIPCGAGSWLDQFPAVLPSPSLCHILCKHNRKGGMRGGMSGWEGARSLKRALPELRAGPKFISVSVSPKHPRGSCTLTFISYSLIRKKAAQPLTNETHLCYLPSSWELETFLHSAHPTNMLWSFLSVSWSRLGSAPRHRVCVVGLARGQEWAGPLVWPSTRNGSHLPLAFLPSSCGPRCSCGAPLLPCAPHCFSQSSRFWSNTESSG